MMVRVLGAVVVVVTKVPKVAHGFIDHVVGEDFTLVPLSGIGDVLIQNCNLIVTSKVACVVRVL